MRLNRQIFVALVLAAWAASLVPTDARQRGKQGVGHHVGVQQPAGTGLKGRGTASPAVSPGFTRKSTIGTTTPPAGGMPPKTGSVTIPGPNAIGAARSNAIGARARVIAVPAAPAATAKISPGAAPTTFVRSAAPAMAHSGGISGTGMTRPGTTPGAVGGPAKLAGGINGTGLRPKR